MNESAMAALTAPSPNYRQRLVLALARICIIEYPRLNRADRNRAFNEAFLAIVRADGITRSKYPDSKEAVSRFINDIVDVWQSFIDNPELMKE